MCCECISSCSSGDSGSREQLYGCAVCDGMPETDGRTGRQSSGSAGRRRTAQRFRGDQSTIPRTQTLLCRSGCRRPGSSHRGRTRQRRQAPTAACESARTLRYAPPRSPLAPQEALQAERRSLSLQQRGIDDSAQKEVKRWTNLGQSKLSQEFKIYARTVRPGIPHIFSSPSFTSHYGAGYSYRSGKRPRSCDQPWFGTPENNPRILWFF